MKFEEMKKIWDEQNKQHLFVIDEDRLRQSIEEKKGKSSRLVNRMEVMAILANGITGSVLLSMNFIKHVGSVLDNLLALLMIVVAIYILTRRSYRLKHENKFDRTMLGDLEHAISNATYQAQLSYGMLLYIIPVGILVLLNAMSEGQSPVVLFLIALFFVVVSLLGRWEHRSWHVARKKRLEAMREKLME